MKRTEYPITPIGKPRMTQRDKWKKRPAVEAYHAFKDEVRIRGVELPKVGAHIIFVLPMPASWPKAKRALLDGDAHRQRPDVDNLLKALMDACYGEDCGLWDVHITKRWGIEGKIIIDE